MQPTDKQIADAARAAMAALDAYWELPGNSYVLTAKQQRAWNRYEAKQRAFYRTLGRDADGYPIKPKKGKNDEKAQT